MNLSEAFPRITTLLILLVILVSGPMVPSLDFTTSPLETSVPVEDINATITVVDPPTGEVYIAPGRGDSEMFLHTPDARVLIREVTGTPILVYEINLIGLGQTAASITILNEEQEGHELVINIDRIPIQRGKITESSYAGEMSIRIRAGNGSTEVYKQNLTVTVEGTDDG